MRRKFATGDAANAIGAFTQGVTALLRSESGTSLYRALAGIEAVKTAFQQLHNYNHTLAMLAAKEFLEREYPELPWEEIRFTGSANIRGADIRVERPPVRIVGEVKTTDPCSRTNLGTRTFGSNQRKEIEKDLEKLSGQKYDGFAKYMFVTSKPAYECLVQEYRLAYPTICYVLLSSKPEIYRPPVAGDSIEMRET